MSKRIILKKLTQKVEESKGTSLAATSTPDTKWIVIQEKCPRDEVPNVTSGKMSSKGKEVMPPPEAKKKARSMARPNEVANMAVTRLVVPGEVTSANPIATLGPRVTILRCPATVEKLLEAVIPPFDKEEVEKLDLD